MASKHAKPEKAKPMNIYSEAQQKMLHEYGLGWFADNPCVTSETLEEYVANEYTAMQFKRTLEKEKSKIETNVGHFTLDRNIPELRKDPTYPELRCLILGKVGQGKSSLGNLLTGEDGFEVFATVKTGTRGSHFAASKKYNLHIIDTQGFADAGGGEVDFEMSKIFTNFKAGIHAFIFVLELSNPRLTEEDFTTFKNLEKTFGKDILNYVFIVFTKAGALLGAQTKGEPENTLQGYIDQLKETPLAEALKVIGNNIIAVENKCVKYQQDLTRQAVLDLINDSVSRSPHGCFTHEVLKEAEEEMKKEKERRANLRKRQKEDIEAKLIKVVKQDLSILQSPNDVIQKADEGRTIAERFLQQNKTINIEGMSSTREFVTDTAERVLKELVKDYLKIKLAEHVESRVTDPDKEVDVYIKALKEDFPRPFAAIGERYIKKQLNYRISLLKENRRIEEVEKAKKKKALREMVRTFIFEHISLFDNPGKINDRLPKKEQFRGEDMQNVIEECLQGNDIRDKIETEQKRRRAVMEKQTRELEIKLKHLIHEKLVKAKDIDSVLDMLNCSETCVLDQLYHVVKASIQNDWMSEESHKNFIQNIGKVMLKQLADENLKDRVSCCIDREINNPDLGVAHYLKRFASKFSSVADQIGEQYISTEVQRKVLDLNEKNKALQEEISSFICDHINIFDNPERIREELQNTGNQFRRKDIQQLIQNCLEVKKVRNEIRREQNKRLEVEESLRKVLGKEVLPFIQRVSNNAKTMADVEKILTKEKNKNLDDVYRHVERHVHTIEWMSIDDRKRFVEKVAEPLLKEHVKKDLEGRVTQMIKTDITDTKRSVDEHIKRLASKYAFATSIVGEAFISSEVRQQILVLKERQQEKEAEEARKKKEMQNKICKFLTEHIDLYNDSKKIQEMLEKKGKDFQVEDIKEMIENCLQNQDVQNKIQKHKDEKRAVKTKKLLQLVGKSAEEEVAKFICKTSNSKLCACAKDPIKAEGYISKLAKRVEQDISHDIHGYVTTSEVQAVVSEVFTLTIDNITDANFMGKVKMFFSPLLGMKISMSVMLPYVGKVGKVVLKT